MKNKVQSIRLRGMQVLQFEEGFDPSISLTQPPQIILNIEGVLARAGFTADEISYMLATAVDGLSAATAGQQFGWNASRVDKVRRAIAEKRKVLPGSASVLSTIRRSGGNSTHLAFEETAQTWALATISADVLAEEVHRSRSKSIYLSCLPNPADLSTTNRSRILKLQLPDIQSALQAERLKLANVLEKSHSVAMEVSEAEQELRGLNAAAARDAEDSILEERKQDPSYPKLIATAEKNLADVHRREAAFNGALNRQQAKVDDLTAQIESRRLESFRLDLGSAPREFAVLLKQLGEKARAIEVIAFKLGAVGDVIYADLSQYRLIDKGGMREDQSMHLRFLNDENTFRFTYRVDGQSKWHSAVTPYKGTTTVSPFVTLAAR